MSGQTIQDRITAAKHSLVGAGLAKSVCKATTEEVIGPKGKHLKYLLQCTNEPNVSIPQLANLLIERSQHTSWVVVFKGLITIHHLMCYGNERFTQYLASSNCTFQLNQFVDKTGVQGYDMSTYIRRYAKYLNEKAYSYRTMAFDFCKVKRGKEDGMLRTMNPEKLLKTLPILQNQLDALLDFECTPNELTNGVINSAFVLLFKDLIRLFACYNDGIINLLEKYFDMNKKDCKTALDLYKKFLVRMDRVAEFLKVAENVGIDKGEIPDLAKAPSSLVDALEQHLNSMEGKGKATAKPTAQVESAINKMSTTGNAFGAAASGGMALLDLEIDPKKALEEEEKRIEELRQQHEQSSDIFNSGTSSWKAHEQQKMASPTNTAESAPSSTNPFATAQAPAAAAPPPSTASSGTMDLFDLDTPPVVNNAGGGNDFLAMGSNPFANNAASLSAAAPVQPLAASANVWGAQQNGFQQQSPPGQFAKFEAAFGSQPAPSVEPIAPVSTGPTKAEFDAFGDVLQPTRNTNVASMPAFPQQMGQQKKAESILKGADVNQSLASLADSLTINGPALKKSEHQWNPSSTTGVRTGGMNWQPVVTPATAATWGSSPQHQAYNPYAVPPQAQPMGPRMGMPMAPPMGVVPSMGFPQQSMGIQPGMQPAQAFPQQPQPRQTMQNDPFGAL